MVKVQPLPRDLYPADLIMVGHWAMALKVALGNPQILKAYRLETSDEFKAKLIGVDLINESTGEERDFLIRFVKWFNVNVWGSLNTVAGE